MASRDGSEDGSGGQIMAQRCCVHDDERSSLLAICSWACPCSPVLPLS